MKIRSSQEEEEERCSCREGEFNGRRDGVDAASDYVQLQPGVEGGCTSRTRSLSPSSTHTHSSFYSREDKCG